MNINEIDFKNIHLQSKGIQFLCAFLLALLILGVSYFLLFNTQIEEYKAAQEKEEQLKEDFTSKSILAANLENLEKELVLIEQSINDLLKQLPTDAQIPSLIQEMHQAAAKNGLTMSNVIPQATVVDGQIERLPFAIATTGSHEQIINFTRDLGRMSRIVTLSSISVKKVDTDKKDVESGKLTFSALANTYKAIDIPQAASVASMPASADSQ